MTIPLNVSDEDIAEFANATGLICSAYAEMYAALREIAPVLAEKGQRDDEIWAAYSHVISALHKAKQAVQ